MWSSVLTIRALPINDGIVVACDIVSFNPAGFIQKGANLVIKGMHTIYCYFFLHYSLQRYFIC